MHGSRGGGIAFWRPQRTGHLQSKMPPRKGALRGTAGQGLPLTLAQVLIRSTPCETNLDLTCHRPVLGQECTIVRSTAD